MSPRRTRPLLENWGSVSNKQTHKHKLSITFCSIWKLYSISRILLLLIKNVIKFLFDGLHLCIFYMCFCVLYGIAVAAACFLCVVLDIELLKIGWSMRRSNKNERDFKNQELHNCNTENKKHRKAREMMLWLVFILNLAESRVTRRAGLWEHLKFFILVLITEVESPANYGWYHFLAEILACVWRREACMHLSAAVCSWSQMW